MERIKDKNRGSGIVLLTAFISFFAPLFGQDVILDAVAGHQLWQGQGTFWDDGRENNYTVGYSDTITICPEDIGKKVRFIVKELDIHPADQLLIYDDADVNGSLIVAENSPHHLFLGDTIEATNANTSGCLTTVFTTDASSPGAAGWEFEIQAFFPCQSILTSARFNGLKPEEHPGGILNLCIGDQLNIAGTASYPDMGTPGEFYPQSNFTSVFQWRLENLADGSGINQQAAYDSQKDSAFANFTITQNGLYLMRFLVQDANSENRCTNNNSVSQLVWIGGGQAMFSNESGTTRALKEQIYVGEKDTLLGYVQLPRLNRENLMDQPALIPDGVIGSNGSTLVLTKTILAHPKDNNVPGSGLIGTASDIDSICLDIEHSAIGDLNMTLICPTGQSVKLLSSSIFSISNFGEPIDVPGNTDPGILKTYCFSQTATDKVHDVASTLQTVEELPAKHYLPEESLDGLIGCEMNGSWSLIIEDIYINDNGFARNLDIHFSESNQPVNPAGSLSASWVESANNPEQGTMQTISDTLIIQANTPGTYCYHYQLSDSNCGLSDTTICVEVLEAPEPEADFKYRDSIICQEDQILIPIFFNNGEAGDFTINPSGGPEIDSATGKLTVSASDTGTYIVTNTLGADVHQYELMIVKSPEFSLTAFPNDTLCVLTNLVVSGLTWDNFDSMTIYPPPELDTFFMDSTISFPNPGTYVFRLVAGYHTCASDTVSLSIVVNGLPETQFLNEDSVLCVYYEPIVLNALPEGGVFSGLGVSDSLFDPHLVDVGIHTVRYEVIVNGCIGSAELALTVESCDASSLGEYENELHLEIYPNPVDHRLYLDMESDMIIEQFELRNAVGQTIRRWDGNAMQKGLSVEDIPDGYYHLLIFLNGEKVIRNLIIKH
ncbi:MAG: T9SS type A sorting domain-containing protein [Bacteroidetes bacterium]|nr:MAG: T9SS type A sorting domain-containing protein [Bacteroidota bacterium]